MQILSKKPIVSKKLVNFKFKIYNVNIQSKLNSFVTIKNTIKTHKGLIWHFVNFQPNIVLQTASL